MKTISKKAVAKQTRGYFQLMLVLLIGILLLKTTSSQLLSLFISFSVGIFYFYFGISHHNQQNKKMRLLYMLEYLLVAMILFACLFSFF